MAITALKNQFSDQMILIFIDQIHYYHGQIRAFEICRSAFSQKQGETTNEVVILFRQMEVQICTSFADIAELRKKQCRICQDCIDLLDQESSQIKTSEQLEDLSMRIQCFISQLDKLDQDFSRCVPLLTELMRA